MYYIEDALQYSRLIIPDLLRWKLARNYQSCTHDRGNIPFLADYYSLIISKAWASLQFGSPRLPNSFKVTLATVNRTTATGNRKCELHRSTVIQCTNSFRYDVNTNHGTAADLLGLSNALHARGMYLMVDVVANHMVSSSYLMAV